MAISRGSINHTLSQDIIAAVTSILRRQSCSAPRSDLRRDSQRFIANFFEVKHCILMPYARTCFYTVLKSLNLPPESEVLMTAFNIAPMLHIVHELGLKPKIIDINLEDFGPDYEMLEEELSLKPRCFLVTYLFGMVPDISLISDLCKKYQVYLIEDISQNIGGKHNGKRLGTFGDAAIYSASITKYVDGYNGAFILTNHNELYRKATDMILKFTKPSAKRIRLIILRTLIWNAALSRYIFSLFTYPALYLLRMFSRTSFDRLIGPSISCDFNKPLPDYYFEDIAKIQVKTITKHIARLDDLILKRKAMAYCAINAFDDYSNKNSCFNRFYRDMTSTFWQFVVPVTNTAIAQDNLFIQGVETGITNLPDLGSLNKSVLKNAIRLKNEFIFIPLHSNLKEFDYRRIKRILQ